jgi:hypothetical protein
MTERNSLDGCLASRDCPALRQFRLACLMPLETGMAIHPTELVVPTQDGYIAKFTYGLSSTQGWDVRAQIGDRVLTRHCSSWRGVERVYLWLLTAPRQALLRSTP